MWPIFHGLVILEFALQSVCSFSSYFLLCIASICHCMWNIILWNLVIEGTLCMILLPVSCLSLPEALFYTTYDYHFELYFYNHVYQLSGVPTYFFETYIIKFILHVINFAWYSTMKQKLYVCNSTSTSIWIICSHNQCIMQIYLHANQHTQVKNKLKN